MQDPNNQNPKPQFPSNDAPAFGAQTPLQQPVQNKVVEPQIPTPMPPVDSPPPMVSVAATPSIQNNFSVPQSTVFSNPVSPISVNAPSDIPIPVSPVAPVVNEVPLVANSSIGMSVPPITVNPIPSSATNTPAIANESISTGASAIKTPIADPVVEETNAVSQGVTVVNPVPVVVQPQATTTQPSYVPPMPSTITQPQSDPVPPSSPQAVVTPAIQTAPPTLASVLTPQPVQAVSQQPTSLPPQAIPAAQAAPLIAQKKGFPKIVLFVALGLLMVLLLIFLVVRVMGTGNTALVGTKGEIVWWGVSLEEDEVDSVISDFESQNSGISITYVKQSENEYRERLTNALASGKGPDIFEIHNSWLPMYRSDLSVLPSSVMSTEEYKSNFYPVYTADLTTSKGIVGIPLEYDALTLYVNEAIFSSALRTPPKTWNDVKILVDPVSGLTQKDEDNRIIQSGIALGLTENIEYWPEIFALMMYQNNANFADVSSQKMKDVVTFYNYFSKVGAWDSTLPKSISAFAKERSAMIFAPAREAEAILQESPNIRFKTYPLPQLEKEISTQPDYSYATYRVQSVWSRSTNAENAWKFLTFASEPASLQKMNLVRKEKGKIPRAYPRPTLNQEFVNDPILGSVVALAQSAKSWYLYDKTNDGRTGLNTVLRATYGKIISGTKAEDLQVEVTKTLTQYGIPIPK